MLIDYSKVQKQVVDFRGEWHWDDVSEKDIKDLKTHSWKEYNSTDFKCNICGEVMAGGSRRGPNYLYFHELLNCNDVMMESACS